MTDEALSSIFGFSLRIEYVALNYDKNGVIRVTEKRMIYTYAETVTALRW